MGRWVIEPPATWKAKRVRSQRRTMVQALGISCDLMCSDTKIHIPPFIDSLPAEFNKTLKKCGQLESLYLNG